MTSPIMLRPRQKTFVDNCCRALSKEKNTLGVANTGFGKTIALSAATGRRIKKKKRALIMAHRDELTRQNSDKFNLVNPTIPVSFFNADSKSFNGQTVFSMVQTLSQERHLASMPPFDLVVIDEAHHAASDSYRRVIARAMEKNRKAEILGVTATPERSDRRGLRKTFSNVADVVTIGEMVQAGHLVPPKAMVVDIGTQGKLKNVKKTANDFDQAEVEAIQNTNYNNGQIVSKWGELAGDRPTVAFCSTIQHAEDVRDAFRESGIEAEAVHGNMGMKKRREILAAFDRGEIPVLCNPMILTEGWDCPVCSCVMLLRTSSHKSTAIQMVGRGLRKVDPEQYPGFTKKDCLVLDFGITLLSIGDLNSTVKLKEDGATGEAGESEKKPCPDCDAKLPLPTKTCPLCGYEFRVELIDGVYNEAAELRLIEIELINKSPFRWTSLWGSEKLMLATGFEAWSAVCSPDGDAWHTIGGKGRDVKALGATNRLGAIATADDWMRAHETDRNAKKAARWMTDPATQKQRAALSKFGGCGHLSKIEAAAYLTFHYNRRTIECLLGV
jgi:superfamily II DNA or RNA helicase